MVRPETPADYDAIDIVVSKAFGRDLETRLVRLLRDDADAYRPELSLVATVEGAVVGHIMLTNATLHGDEDRRVLALGPLAVAPARQRAGIGGALTEAALARADAQGEPLVVLLGQPDYYPRFGFQPARAQGVEPPSQDMPDAAFMMKRLSAYDARYRGRFEYAPAFETT